MPVKLGSLELKTDLILAPMMDITTPSFRQLIINQGGVGMVVTPMIFVQQIAQAPKTVLSHLEHLESQRPNAIQIVSSGKNEPQIKKTLDFISPFNFDAIDINAGCPAPHTMKSGGGGALLRDFIQNFSTNEPSRLERLLSLCLKYTDRPVSVKTRLGFDSKDHILDLARMVERTGAEFLTLHGRTLKQKYGGSVDLETIRLVKESVEMPIVGNGDVRTYEDYIKMKEVTGCDAVMIGRAATFNPRIFSNIAQQDRAVRTGLEIPPSPTVNNLDLIRNYIRENETFITNSSKFWNTDRFILAESRRLAIWLIKGIPGYRRVRQRLSKISERSVFKDYFFGPRVEEDFQKQRELESAPL